VGVGVGVGVGVWVWVWVWVCGCVGARVCRGKVWWFVHVTAAFRVNRCSGGCCGLRLACATAAFRVNICWVGVSCQRPMHATTTKSNEMLQFSILCDCVTGLFGCVLSTECLLFSPVHSVNLK